MLFFNTFPSWLRIGLSNTAVSWMEVFVKNLGGFKLLVIVTKDLFLVVAGSYILSCLLIFVKNCMCFEFLVLKFICL